MAPRHIFEDDQGAGEEEEELAGSDGEERPPSGSAGVVAQCLADAKLAEEGRFSCWSALCEIRQYPFYSRHCCLLLLFVVCVKTR